MRAFFVAVVFVLGAGTSGCAYFTTYNKQIDLKNGSVAIDAKQRVIYSRENKSYTGNNGFLGIPVYDKQTIICAEPSPDALSVLGASNALSISDPTGVSGSGSSSLAEAAASIGLRTQSIQLLRDLNYRMCEAYSNDAISEAEAGALLRRGQSTMMGLIAIEQLTGPVVSSQVALSSSGQAGTGTAAAADVTAAQKLVDDKKALYLTAAAEADTAEATLQTNKQTLVSAEKKHSDAVQPKDPATAQSVIDSAQAAVDAARTAVTTAETALKDKERRRASAKEDVDKAEVALAALKAGTSMASSRSVAEMTHARIQSAQVTQALVKGVSKIVDNINTSYLRDGCFSLVSELLSQQRMVESLAQQRLIEAASRAMANPNASGTSTGESASAIAVRSSSSQDVERNKLLYETLGTCKTLFEAAVKAEEEKSKIN